MIDKRIRLVFWVYCLLCVLTVILTSCGVYNNRDIQNKESDNRLTVLYTDMYGYEILVDNYTGVQYLSRTRGGTVVMVDKNGNPLIFEEEAFNDRIP